MGDAPKQKIVPPPPSADLARAEINALAYAEMQRRIQQSQGMAGQFLKTPKVSARPPGWKSALGQ